jgi:hypothetical protein
MLTAYRVILFLMTGLVIFLQCFQVLDEYADNHRIDDTKQKICFEMDLKDLTNADGADLDKSSHNADLEL